MYEGDSFWTLGLGGRIALVTLSATLSALLIAAAWRLARGRGALSGGLIGLGLWWLFAWLSPQVYYLLYLALFDGLPWQIVIGAPPGPGRVLDLLGFTGRATLSDHTLGGLGWASALTGVLTALRRGASG